MTRVTPRLALLAALAGTAALAHAQLKPPRSPAPAAAPAATPAPAATSAAAPAASPHADKEAAGRLAAQGWLVLLDRRDWGTAWEASSPVFRQAVPLGSWMDGIPKVREPLGALVERQPAETVHKTSLPGRPDGDYVTVLFVSRFDKRERVEELVTTVRDGDGRWRVTGYTAR